MRLKFSLVMSLLLVALVGGSVATAQGGPPPALPFAGCWQSIDPADGSQQYLLIQLRGRSTATLLYVDWAAYLCGVDENDVPIYPAYIWSQGTVDGNTMYFDDAMIVCWTDPPTELFETPLFPAVYDPVTDTLGEVWTRVPMKECVPKPPKP